MVIFSSPIIFSSQLHLGVAALLLRCQGEIIGEFSLFIPIMINRIPKIRNSRIHFPFNFFVISINIFYLPQKKFSWINFQCIRIKNYPRITTLLLHEPYWHQIRTCGVQIFYSTAVNFSNGFGTLSQTPRFRRNSNRTPNGWEMDSELRLCSAVNNADEQWWWTVPSMNSVIEEHHRWTMYFFGVDLMI